MRSINHSGTDHVIRGVPLIGFSGAPRYARRAAGGVAIWCEGVESAVVESNTISGSAYGIVVAGTGVGAVVMKDNRIRDNDVAGFAVTPGTMGVGAGLALLLLDLDEVRIRYQRLTREALLAEPALLPEPEHRRRGIQSGLIAARLRALAECRLRRLRVQPSRTIS